METVDVLIKNANELITLKGPNKPRIKKQLNNLSIIKNGDLAIKDETILDVGKNLKYKSEKIINAKGKTVMPGFVDPHTHLIFAGSREFELDMKLRGYSYLDILKKGGGIFYTVNETRKATSEKLFKESKQRLDKMLSYGTTTCEAKSGYGLDTDSELKILHVQKKINSVHPVDIISTFLGAHAIPKGYSSKDYVDKIINEMIPKIKKLANFCDVFCEKGFFTNKQSKEILDAGKKNGLIPKIHADELSDTKGAALAAEIEAISADHLLLSNDDGLKKMADKNVVGVLLPATSFSLMQKNYAPARKMIDLGVPVALATDLNPNCWTENMQFIIQLACLKMKMTLSEAITASTFNAACALKMNNNIGSLEKSKQADLIILNCPNHKFLAYHYGINLIEKVIKKGCLM